MAFRRFWQSVADVAGVREHYVRAPEAKRITAETVRTALARTSAWLTPNSVAGFEVSDVSFLSEPERNTLTSWVADFRALAALRRNHKAWCKGLFDRLTDGASVVSFAKEWAGYDYRDAPDGGLTEAEVGVIADRLDELAAAPFASIVSFLELDRFRDAEAFRLGKQIETRLRADAWPEGLEEIWWESGEDHSGDPGLWIWAILADAVAEPDARFHATTRRIRALLRDAANAVTFERFPYIAFRTAGERIAEPEAA